MGYLLPYHVFVCLDLQGGLYCGYALPLDSVVGHINPWTLSEGRLRNSHCHKDLGGRKGKIFTEKLAHKYPGACKNREQLRAIDVLPNQRGPILGLRPPVDGYRCLFKGDDGIQCLFVTRTTSSGERHWSSHNAPKNYLKRPNGKRGTIMEDGFTKVVGRIQSFSWDSKYMRLLELPPWDDSIEPEGSMLADSGGNGAVPVDAGELLHQQHLKLFGPPKTAVDLRMKSTLPFFVNTGAADFIASFDPKSFAGLVALPQKSEPLLLKLRDPAVARCLDGCKAIRSGPPAIRRLLKTSLP